MSRRYDYDIKALYRAMPGAELPVVDQRTGEYYWGDVEHTPHWQFCEAIVDLIESAKRSVGVVSVEPD